MRPWLVLTILFTVLLAGCSDATPGKVHDKDDFDVDVEVDDSTGAIRGVVVDEMIVPVAEAAVVLVSVDPALETTTDAEGRFVFSKVAPGPHIISVTKYGHIDQQASTQVEAGIAEPAVVRIQIQRAFSETPYTDEMTFDGRIVCSYSARAAVTGINAPCITDYTSIVCPGGCAPQLREVQGDTRDWAWTINAGWKSHITEMQWVPSAQGTSDRLGFSVSYSGRTASEWFATFSGTSPLLGRIDCCEPHPSRQQADGIPEEGIEDLYTFANANGEDVGLDVAIEQDFQAIWHTFYHLEAPDGWSFMGGDEAPF